LNKKKLTPLRAIRAKCLDCSAGSPGEVRKCHIEDCPLFPFRFGHNPRRSGIGCKNSKFRKKDKLSAGFSNKKIKDRESVKEDAGTKI
jgi:hypothetical protein